MSLCVSAADERLTKVFADAYELGLPVLTSFLLKRGMNSDTARELAQAAWVKAWEHIPELRNIEFLRSWTTSIAINLMRDTLNRRNRWESIEKVSPLFHPSTAAAIDVEHILSVCTESERRLLTRHYLQGHSMREIARQEGCSELGARLRLLRARKSAQRWVRKRT